MKLFCLNCLLSVSVSISGGWKVSTSEETVKTIVTCNEPLTTPPTAPKSYSPANKFMVRIETGLKHLGGPLVKVIPLARNTAILMEICTQRPQQDCV